ncbi:Methyltransferase type 11 [Dillenia turbinata]|uniref:Methyltransferase type 11 n=1 Tax=Dillenia turbinata TaxID=194707 RepID=A0AAN8VTS6_9MAGN
MEHIHRAFSFFFFFFRFRPHNLLHNLLVRILSFCLLISLARFAYVLTIKGGQSCDSCFFSSSSSDNLLFPHYPSSSAFSSDDLSIIAHRPNNNVNYYRSIFQDLVSEGFLSPDSTTLCLDSLNGLDVLALREIGVLDSIGVSKIASPPLVVSRKPSRLPFDDESFDFEFSDVSDLDRSNNPVIFASEAARTLKSGGYFVAHTMAKDTYSLNSFLDLFNCCRFIRSREIDNLDSPVLRVHEIIIKKESVKFGKTQNTNSVRGNYSNKCSVRGYKRELVRLAEPLITEETLKPWITRKRNIKYLSSMVDISFKRRYIYIDVGSRNYGSSIGSWFLKQYPKQNKKFEIYAVEADKVYHEEYRSKKGVTLLPYAAWVRNETLFFEINREPSSRFGVKRRGMGAVQSSMRFVSDADKIQGFDFAHWLQTSVSKNDFVVMKMDVEGTEFHLIPRLLQTGAMCLIDEMFLECHYNRSCPGIRSPKYNKTYSECLDLFWLLRTSGVLVHQW